MLSVSRWESGKVTPRAAQLERIQAVLRIGKREAKVRLQGRFAQACRFSQACLSALMNGWAAQKAITLPAGFTRSHCWLLWTPIKR